MNSNLAAARATMLDADQAIRHGGHVPYANAPDPGFRPAALFAAMDRHNAAAATVDRIASYLDRARETRKRHMAGDHTTPTIGTCAICLDNYVRGIK